MGRGPVGADEGRPDQAAADAAQAERAAYWSDTGTQALLSKIQSAAGQRPEGISEGAWEAAGERARADTQKERSQINAYNAAMSPFRRGETIFNPQATWWDWVTAPIETGIYGASRALTGGLFGLDFQLGKHDVTGYKGRTDISNVAGGVKGPQNFGLQVDVGIPGASSIFGPVTPDIATVDFSYGRAPSIYSAFDPESGAIGKAAVAASDYYNKKFAEGGLASLPQISQSGLYRAMGRG
jgi:hypothetical protein